jgi:regulator of protease activity HflC (stomatin/prohibitin superfamily)
MAQITHYPLVAHLRGAPSAQQLLWKGGKLRRSGRGLAFWFQPLSANLAEIPLDDRELAFLFHARTADFQDAVCQGVITYRVADPEALAARIDFSLDLETGLYAETPLDQIADRLTQLAQQHVWGIVNGAPLGVLMANGVEQLRDAIGGGLETDPGLVAMGLEVVSVRVSSIEPDATVEKALQTPTRESIQQQADQAVFSRRALAVEKERAIAENELKNRIELARRQAQLVDQEGLNERRRAEEAAAAARIEAEGSADRTRISAAASAESLHAIEGERVALEKERIAAYGALSAPALMALAAREFAAKIERIEHLNISPDMLSPFIADLAAAGAARLTADGRTRSGSATPAPGNPKAATARSK